VLKIDGHRFLVEIPGGLRTVSSDHVTAARATPVQDAKWTRALRSQALFKVDAQVTEGPKFVFEVFLKHDWDHEGRLKVLVKWFVFPEKESRWQLAFSLHIEEIRKYCVRKRVNLPTLTRDGVFSSDPVDRQA